jgi:hypothetical protein
MLTTSPAVYNNIVRPTGKIFTTKRLNCEASILTLVLDRYSSALFHSVPEVLCS